MQKNKNMQVEGLRGLACLIIVIFHTVYQFQVFVLGQQGPSLLAHWGEIGVGIFLFISGFFLVDFSNKSKFSLLQFYKRRILRLWPIYATCVFLIFVIRMLTTVPNFEPVNWSDLILNISFINGFIGTQYIEPAHWYMTTLLRATIVIGVLRRTGLHKYTETYGLWLLLIVGMKILQRTITNTALQSLIHVVLTVTGGAYTGVFVLAFLMRKLFVCVNIHDLFRRENWKELLVLGMSIIFLVGLPGIIYTIVILGGGLLVWLCMKKKLPIMDNRLLTGVAEISFVWYLIHQYISYYIEMMILSIVNNQIVASSTAILITMTMSIVIHYLIELPIQDRIVRT